MLVILLVVGVDLRLTVQKQSDYSARKVVFYLISMANDNQRQ